MENNSTKNKKKNGWLIPASLILIFVAIIAFIILLLNGRTTITGEFTGSNNSETVSCESDEVPYSGFAFDESDSKNLKINAVFENEKLVTISLMYKLNYSDKDTLSFSEARNHAEINESFDDDGMKPDSLSAKYGIMSDGMQFSIFAKDNDIDTKTLKYFMLYNIYDIDSLTKEKMAKKYNEKGLDCEIKHNTVKEEENENQ